LAQSGQIKNRASDGAVFVNSEEAFFIGPIMAKNNRRTSRRSFFGASGYFLRQFFPGENLAVLSG